ncbi:MAG TPA: J domain-containing protein [Vicinamibacterales bacterium]|jgi:molecular chaperone DnaJ
MDFYIVLGLDRDASLNEIKRAYKRLARKFHPDINPGDRMAAAHFREIAAAYETLSDPDRRRHYDMTGATSELPSGQGAYGFEGFDFSVRVSGADASTFGDLFADVFQRETHRHDRVERGIDLHQALTIPFEEAVHGGQHTLTVTRQEHCRMCTVDGRPQTPEVRCAHCDGTGSKKSVRGHMVFSRPCAQCGGLGRLRQARCPTCGGQQVEVRTETLTVNVPPGLADGARIRVAGKGHVGRNGGENGDLYITVHIEPHPVFRREGDDLHITVPVALHEAALGAKIEVPSLDGPARLRVPPGTQSGQRFHLRERGLPSPRDRRRGDLVVEVRLVLPKMLDERSKELLREFGRINGSDVRRELGGDRDPGR